MAKRPRRNHTAAFKAKVALEAVKENSTVTETHAYDDANQITDSGYSYDANGNLVTSANGWTYYYDRGSRLVLMASPSADSIIQFEYDAKGRRVHKKVMHYNDQWTLKYHVYYHYDANGNILCETDASWNVIRSYAYCFSSSKIPCRHQIKFPVFVKGNSLLSSSSSIILSGPSRHGSCDNWVLRR